MRSSLVSFVDDCLKRGGETALAHRRGLRVSRWSYARLARTAYQFARELEARGIGKGERVLLWGGNSPEWVAAFFGCVLRGVVVVPLDAEGTPDFAARVHAQVQARLLLRGEPAPHCELGDGLSSLPLEHLTEAVERHGDAPYPSQGVGADDLLEIIYTSGTTAEPRGIVLTHRNVLANLAPLEAEIKKYLRWERLIHPLRFLNLLPLSHVFGQFMGIFVPQLLGGEVFFQDSLNPSEVVETIRKRRISVAVCVPRMLETLREHVERREEARGRASEFRAELDAAKNLHPLKRLWKFRKIHSRFGWKFWAFVSGGATLSEETEKFWLRLGFPVLQGYGMTETASLITVNHPFKKARGSVGQSLPAQEVRLSEGGEILVRGANVSPGYWQGGVRPLADEEGWLRTGDLGEMDEAGNVYFRGRKKDVIVTAAGLNIFPEDLEAALNRQPEVRASAVVTVEGAHGPEPLAVLILKDERGDPSRVVERANQTLAPYQHMRRWHVWPDPDFPRTPTQKIQKRLILERLREEGGEANGNGSGGGKALENMIDESKAFVRHPSSVILDSVTRAGGAAPAVQIGPSASLATDLKLDSLGRVELLSALEDRYQVELDEAAFTAATTLGDIEKIIHEGAAREDASAQYPYPEWTQRFPLTWLRVAFFYLVVLPVSCVLCWARVRGKENLEGLKGPLLFVSNHITFVDHALILSGLPSRYRRSLAVAQEGERLRWWRRPPAEYGWLKRLRWRLQYVLVVSIFNTFSLPQKSGFRRSFAFAGETVDRGYSVLVFPEGTRTEDGRLNPFKAGTGLLATRLGLPVVPVRIDGLFELKREGRRHFAPPGSVTVTFGQPVSFAPEADPSEVAAELERRVANLF